MDSGARGVADEIGSLNILRVGQSGRVYKLVSQQDAHSRAGPQRLAPRIPGKQTDRHEFRYGYRLETDDDAGPSVVVFISDTGASGAKLGGNRLNVSRYGRVTFTRLFAGTRVLEVSEDVQLVKSYSRYVE